MLDEHAGILITRVMLLGIIVGSVVLTVTACSSEQPKPMVQPTTDQVRGHADRAFDKLKQEEQERAVNPPAQR